MKEELSFAPHKSNEQTRLFRLADEKRFQESEIVSRDRIMNHRLADYFPGKFAMTRAVSGGVLVEDVSFSALLPLKWSSPAKGNRPILPHEQIIFGNGRRRSRIVRHERISPATNRHGKLIPSNRTQ